MKLHARPNLNGNSVQDFYEVYLDFERALSALDNAACQMRTDVLHGRNYPGVVDRIANGDRAAVEAEIADAKESIKTLKNAVQDLVLHYSKSGSAA